MSRISLVPIDSTDADMLFTWQINPLTRRYFNTPTIPSFDEHVAWVERILKDDSVKAFMILCEEKVGIVRLNFDTATSAEVSILLAPEHYGKGHALSALNKLAGMFPDIDIKAVVHENNAPSQRLFVNAGFTKLDSTTFIKKKMKHNYVVAGTKPWSLDAFQAKVGDLDNWHFISEKENLTIEKLQEISPKYVFFPHWNWIVPDCILNQFECVCFHMTDVPYGRGGSPLQNLIIRGHKETKLTALRMTNELDSGPVYLKVPLSLKGTAQEIFEKTAFKIMDLADEISKTEPEPEEQKGEIITFPRRTPAQSKLEDGLPLEKLYDYIRMLDAETYPKAFIQHGEYKIEFDNATLNSAGKLEVRAVITKEE